MTKLTIGTKMVEVNMGEIKANRIVESCLRQGLTVEKNHRKIINTLKKEDTLEQEERNQKAVKEIVINIEWKKSRTCGNCPTAQGTVYYEDGSVCVTEDYRAGGCGYDKESTVIANIFNEGLKYKLWSMENDKEKQDQKPYGVRFDFGYSPSFSSGIGTNCYYDIAKYLGGKFENTASGKTWDSYKITF